MKILITGGNGFIAKALHKSLNHTYEVTSVNRYDFDLTNFIDTKTYLQDKYFDVVIHTAASGVTRTKEWVWKDMDNNLSMYYSLLYNKSSYGKLIHFGSGAEIYINDKPYGFSKSVISKSIEAIDNFYNLRIFAVFDENELDTRFIKSCINKYINKEDIEVHCNKKMDFFYMQDLIQVVEHYINNDDLPKMFNCSYEKKYSLFEIAMMINSLDNYKVAICAKNKTEQDYAGYFRSLGLNYIGLEEGIRQVYNKLK